MAARQTDPKKKGMRSQRHPKLFSSTPRRERNPKEAKQSIDLYTPSIYMIIEEPKILNAIAHWP